MAIKRQGTQSGHLAQTADTMIPMNEAAQSQHTIVMRHLLE